MTADQKFRVLFLFVFCATVVAILGIAAFSGALS